MLKNCKFTISEFYVFGCSGLKEFFLGSTSCLSDCFDYCSTDSEYSSFSFYGKLSRTGSIVYIGCYSVEFGLI